MLRGLLRDLLLDADVLMSMHEKVLLNLLYKFAERHSPDNDKTYDSLQDEYEEKSKNEYAGIVLMSFLRGRCLHINTTHHEKKELYNWHSSLDFCELCGDLKK